MAKNYNKDKLIMFAKDFNELYDSEIEEFLSNITKFSRRRLVRIIFNLKRKGIEF